VKVQRYTGDKKIIRIRNEVGWSCTL